MHLRCKFLLSTAAATLFLSLPGLASETAQNGLDNRAADPVQIESQPPHGHDLKTAVLATPVPSIEKALAEDAVPGILKPEKTENDTPPAPSFSQDGAGQAPAFLDELPALSGDPAKNPENLAEAPDGKAELIEAIKTRIDGLDGGNSLQRKDRRAIAAFYADHAFEPLWTAADGGLNADAKSLVAYLAKAEEDGLDAADYAVELPSGAADAVTLAAAEIRLSEALLHYARDAQAGRVAPEEISSEIKLRPVYPEPESVLVRLATSPDKVEALAGYQPHHAGYRALRAELARLRALGKNEINIPVPEGETMSEGYEGPRVRILRARLNVEALANENAERFDETVQVAVKAFQTENNLIADGIVGARTLDAINDEQTNRIPDIIANMERWRWMARSLGELYVMANVPSYDIVVMKESRTIHRTRIVVGKTQNKTPIFSDVMEYVVVNPYWNVPYSIASKELLPQIRSNPNFVADKNYEVLSGDRVVNPTSVAWNENSFKRLRIRQLPGGTNALGNIKFLFPNDHSIYFHDTPSKNLFERVTRAFSHGCVRVHNPFDFGDVLMRETKGWKNGTLETMIGDKEKWIRLESDERIPVHITYFTAVADDAGTVAYKSDVYGHNTRLKRALGLI